MPVKPRRLDTARKLLRIFFPIPSAGKQKISVHDDPADHVYAMQAGQSEIGGVKIIRAGKMMILKFMTIFEALHDQESQAQ